jgi:hypothetical protein
MILSSTVHAAPLLENNAPGDGGMTIMKKR